MTVSSPSVPPQSAGSPWVLPVPPEATASPTAASVHSVASIPNLEVAAPKQDNILSVSGEEPGEPTRSKRRDKVLYVRVNLHEKEQIVTQAHECRLSISRYLTRRALEKVPPPTEDDRKRMEMLLFHFKRTEVNVRRLHAEASRMRLFSAVPGIEDDFEATLETVRGLIRELGKRL